MGNFPDLTLKGKAGGTATAADRNDEANKAYRLDSAYFELGHDDSLFSSNKTFTIAIWAKPTVRTEVRMVLFSKLGDYQLLAEPGWIDEGRSFTGRLQTDLFPEVDGAGDISYQVSGLYAIGSQPRVDQWSHFALVSDGSQVKVYHNGILRSDSLDISDINALSAGKALWIGARVSSTDRGSFGEFIGEIDDFRYYNQALTQVQIEELGEAK